jgi:hypothetical protein
MPLIRNIRWFFLLTALAASIAWSCTAIHHLLGTSPTRQQELAQYGDAPQQVPAYLKQLDQQQMRWGRQSLFSVALSFLLLLVVMGTWVLDGRPPRRGYLNDRI